MGPAGRRRGCDARPGGSAIGRVAEARLLILDGEVREGLALLDQAGVAAVAGDLDPLSTGVVYCELVCALQGLAQYDLAEQWTEAMERWCDTNAIGSLHGRCRVHRAEILRLRGSCDEAEGQALMACQELSPYLRPRARVAAERARPDPPAPGRSRGRGGGPAGELIAPDGTPNRASPWCAWPRAMRPPPLRPSGTRSTAPSGCPRRNGHPDTDLQRAPLLEAQVEIEIAVGDLGRLDRPPTNWSSSRAGSRTSR